MIIRRIALAVIVGLLLTSVTMTAGAIPPTPVTVLSTPHSVGPKQDRYEAWPDAVTAANGWVVMMHGSTDSHGFPTRRTVVIRLSKDRGNTWQVAKIIRTAGITGGQGLIRLPSGRLVMMVSDMSGQDHFNYVRTIYSDDHGLTWGWLSARIGWTDPWSFGNMVRVTCGTTSRLMIMWNNGTQWGVAASADSGRTWTRSYNTAQHQLIEGRLVQVTGSHLLALGRTDTGLLMFRSPDCGKTWTSAPTGVTGRLTEGAQRHGDIWRVVTIDRDRYATGSPLEVRDGSLTELWNDPTAWSEPKLLRTLRPTASRVDLGYPTLVSVSRSFDLLTWYTGANRQPMIYAARLPWPS
jgi:hypothetical protein